MKPQYTHFSLVLIFFSLLFISCSNEGELSKAENKSSVGFATFLLPDQDGSIPFSVAKNSQDFLPDSILNFDKETDSYWLKIVSKSKINEDQTYYMKLAFIDTVEQYILNEKYNLDIVLSGEDIRIREKAVQYAEYNFIKLNIEPNVNEHFIKLKSASMFSKQLRDSKRFEFYSQDRYDYLSKYTRYFHGNFLGIMFAMIIFNLIIYFIYKDHAYLAYCIFLTVMTAYHLSVTGVLNEFVFYNFPSIGKYAPFYTAALAFYAFVYFAQSYLDSKHFAPKLHRLYSSLYYLNTVNIILSFFAIEIANYVLFIMGAISGIFALIIAIVAARKKSRPAYFYLIASLLTSIAFVIFTLMRLGILPEIFITRYAYQISFALQALLFAMGLADRMILIRKELAEKKLEKERLVIKQEKELNEILARQKEELEVKVKERTLELEEKNKKVEKDRETIKLERQKSEQLLLNILPQKIAERLKSGEEKIAEKYDNVTVFFSDIVGFTEMSKNVGPEELVDILNDIFTRFDKLLVKHGLEKIKTIGDAYMCVSGLPEPKSDHAVRVARFALDVIQELEKIHINSEKRILNVRIGIHSGTVVAGVIGEQKFAYDLWGEAVNLASRLESNGEVMKIQCSVDVKELLENQFEFQERGQVRLKGVGEVQTYFLIKELNFKPLETAIL